MENVFVQAVVTVAGGFALDRLLAVYKNRISKKKSEFTSPEPSNNTSLSSTGSYRIR